MKLIVGLCTGYVLKTYFDVENNNTFASVCLSNVAMAIQYPEFALKD